MSYQNCIFFPGLTWEETKLRCPKDVVPACHNSVDSVTISGPEKSVLAFVDKLQQEGIFAKHVNSSGVAFHSTAMADISHQFRSALKQVSDIPMHSFLSKYHMLLNCV